MEICFGLKLLLLKQFGKGLWHINFYISIVLLWKIIDESGVRKIDSLLFGSLLFVGYNLE